MKDSKYKKYSDLCTRRTRKIGRGLEKHEHKCVERTQENLEIDTDIKISQESNQRD